MGVLSLFVAIFVALVGSSLNVDTETAVPAVYIFGDSIFDVGTNNFLNDSKARADNKPYGIDFPNSKPTGRFSNGYNTADQIGITNPLSLKLSLYDWRFFLSIKIKDM